MFNPRRTSLLKFWWGHVVTSSLCFMTLTSCFTAFRLMRMVRIRSKCPRPMSSDVPGSCDWFFDRVFGWFTMSMRCRPSESWPKFTRKGSSLPAAHLEMIIQKTLASLPEAASSRRKFASQAFGAAPHPHSLKMDGWMFVHCFASRCCVHNWTVA